MFEAVYTKRFEKDMKLARRRGKDLKKIKHVIEMLLSNQSLPFKYHNHWLTGDYANRQECHIEPDWLLIYKPGKKEITFERTGSHSDLFQ